MIPSGPRRGRRRPGFGPGWLVAAAFIGPGTVTTATVAGARFGTALLWTLGFSVVATMALQEMAARLGLVTGAGLGEAVRERFAGAARAAAVLLVVAAIAAGNAAYQTGNLLGAGLGLEGVAGGAPRWWALGIAAVAFALLWTGSYRALERVLTAMVALMGVVFLATALAVAPPLGEIAAGLVVPSLPGDGVVLAVALVGTTVVPYNLFLHAAAVREKWGSEADLPAARLDLVVSIALGGAVSIAIVATAAGTLHGTGATVESAADMATQLEPALGRWAGALFALGLFAAGMTSAITAPLAAAWATAGALGWRRDLEAPGVRAVWIAVLATGSAFAASGVRPVGAILFAQAANGVLLPAMAVFLLVAVNDRRRMGSRSNGPWANAIGAVVTLVAVGLGARAVLSALGVL